MPERHLPSNERRTSAAPKRTLPESGPDRALYDALVASVERQLDAAQKRGAPADLDAYRRRVTNAIDLALEGKQMQGTRRARMQSLLTAEFGRRGGTQAAARRMAAGVEPGDEYARAREEIRQRDMLRDAAGSHAAHYERWERAQERDDE